MEGREGSGARSKKIPAPVLIETPTKSTRPKPLRLLAVVSIVFFNVSGGPLGSEGAVSSFGPIRGLLMVVAFAFCFSMPQAMMTAELSTAFPVNGGYSIWVQTAFGTFWGVQESYWSWCSGVVDTAIYPVLLYSAAQQLLSSLGSSALQYDSYDTGAYCRAHNETAPSSYSYDEGVGPVGGNSSSPASHSNLWACMLDEGSGCATEYGVKLAVLTVFVLPNVFSSALVGNMLTSMSLIAMAPFVALCVVGLPRLDLSYFLLPVRTLNWRRGLSILYWNLSGFDCASTVSGEVDEPNRTFPLALFLALLAIVASYLLPLFVSVGLDPDWDCWVDGSLLRVAGKYGGPWLGAWMLLTSTLGNWGLFAAELLEDSYQLLGMVEMGLAPAFLGGVSARDTPVRIIMLQYVIIALLVSLDFESILCIDNFFSAAAAALEFVALIKLRVSRPELARAYHIPLSGTLPLSLFLSLPIAVSLAVCYVTLVEAADSAGIIVCGLLVGVALYVPFALGWAGEMDSRRLSRAAAEVSPKLAPTATGALLGFHYGSQRTVSRVSAISSRRSSGLF